MTDWPEETRILSRAIFEDIINRPHASDNPMASARLGATAALDYFARVAHDEAYRQAARIEALGTLCDETLAALRIAQGVIAKDGRFVETINALAEAIDEYTARRASQVDAQTG